MTILKCTVCGGDILPQGDAGVCESCGRRISLEGLSEDRRIENRNRANEARVRQDYSAAERAWSRIVADEPDNAEAHWNLAVSRYGIDYVWDELTGDFYAMMNRVRFELFTEDPDYQAAVQYADENGLVYYLEEGKRLAALQERLLSLVKDEEGYDVFLCSGDASALFGIDYAGEIYKELSAKGLRVFYGKEALAGISKQEQESYIFSALYTSRVMVLFASEAGQLTETSVKNEWSRFLAMTEDGEKYLIPAYAHMRPEFFPDEIPSREAVDMTAGGSMMDLVRGVLRFAGKENANGSYEEMLRIRKRMVEELGKKNFREAVRLGNEGTEIAPDDAELWYYLFFAENHISAETELAGKLIDWIDSRSFTRAYELASRQRRKVLDQVKADWEAYQQGVMKDSQMAADEKHARAKYAQTVSRARTLMMKESYQDAYRILNDNMTATDEVVMLREDAALGTEYEKIDRTAYLDETLAKEAPEISRKFRSMTAPLRKGALLPWNAVISLLGTLMMAALYYFGFKNGTLEYGSPEIVINICRIFGPIVFMLGVLSGIFDGVFEAFGYIVQIIIVDVVHFMFLPFVVEELFSKSTETLYMMLMIAFLVLAIIAIRDIPCQSRSRRNRCVAYYKKFIVPKEQKYTDDYRKKYGQLEVYAPLRGLTTVWDKYKIPEEDDLI